MKLSDLEAYTITEAAKRIGIHERNVRELIREGQLSTINVGDKIKVTGKSIEELLPGFKNDPNPDMEKKKQFNPNATNDISRMMDRSSRDKPKQRF